MDTSLYMAVELVTPDTSIASKSAHLAATSAGIAAQKQSSRYAHLSRSEIESLLRESQRRIALLEELSVTDEMLNILNRRGFTGYFRRELATARRDETASGLMLMIDLDDFKSINDAHGHLAGDAVLKAAAEAIRNNVRSCDIVGRMGGDEFGVLLTRAERSRHNRVARIGTALNSAVCNWQGASIPISASIGVASFFGGQSVDDVIAAADRELYVEKRTRKLAHSA